MYVGQSHAIILVVLHMQCKRNDVMTVSCQYKVNHDDIIPMWCSYNTNTDDIIPCESYMVVMECKPQWHHADGALITCKP